MKLTVKRVYSKKVILSVSGEHAEMMDLAGFLSVWGKGTYLPEKERISYEFITGGMEITFPESKDGFEKMGSIFENALSGWDRLSLKRLYKRFVIQKKANQEKLLKEEAEQKKKKEEQEKEKALMEIEAYQEIISKNERRKKQMETAKS